MIFIVNMRSEQPQWVGSLTAVRHGGWGWFLPFFAFAKLSMTQRNEQLNARKHRKVRQNVALETPVRDLKNE